MAAYLLVALHAALTGAVVLRVLLQRPARGVALSWLLLAVMLPYAGAFFYFLIGERRVARGRAERLRRLRGADGGMALPHAAVRAAGGGTPALPGAYSPLARAGQSFFGVPAVGGNQLSLHGGTLDIIRLIAADIDAARASVLMEFYIWQEGGLTAEVRDALIRAAGRGVSCLVLVDAMGAGRWWKGPEPAMLRAAGVDLRAALPVGLIRGLAGRTDLRLHRKIVVIDGATAWTGSMNMVDPRFFKQESGVGEWVDAMARIEGPVAGMLASVVISDWIAERGGDLAQIIGQTKLAPAEPKGAVPVQVVSSGPGESGDGLLQIMLALISAARRELVLTTPYFVPEDALVTALRGASARGVKVTVILPQRIDSLLVRHASRSYFEDILEMGGEIREFRGGLLHTKSITVDGEAVMFGTANFDMRSLWLNYEVSLLVYDPDFTARVRTLQEAYLDASAHVTREDLGRRSFAERLLAASMRLMSPLL
jgi:cardiolipin synthase